MSLRLPMFGLLVKKSPMEGLITHYDKIAECVAVINGALECYVSGGSCQEIVDLTGAIDSIESEADRIKRGIRNHLPRRLFMSVEKTLFLQYTSKQDNILDAAQDALHWLAMRPVASTEHYQRQLINLLDAINDATAALGPALKATISLVNGTSIDREATKETYRKVRKLRGKIRDISNDLTRTIYNSDDDFKDIYQLIHFVECLNDMGHNCSNCVDTLRAMIAR